MTPDQQAFPQPVRIELTSDLGALVKARRREQSLRIDDTAALCGVSVDLLSRLENGKGSVRFDKLLSVLDGLGLALVACPKDHPSLQPPPSARTKRP